ncbi:MAG: hypothetical protein ACI9J5_000545 [Paraglaciecola sp.]
MQGFEFLLYKACHHLLLIITMDKDDLHDTWITVP